MKLYIYPQNLKATANLWLMEPAGLCPHLRRAAPVPGGPDPDGPAVTPGAHGGLRFPLHPHGDLTVLDYIRFAAKFTISTQQDTAGRSIERRKS